MLPLAGIPDVNAEYLRNHWEHCVCLKRNGRLKYSVFPSLVSPVVFLCGGFHHTLLKSLSSIYANYLLSMVIFRKCVSV